MALYNLYAGLGGGFGGAIYRDTQDFDNADRALDEAYEMACEEYGSYEGFHGILSEQEVFENYCEENGISSGDELTDFDYENIRDIYVEAREGWLEYRVILASEDPDKDSNE